MSLKSCERLHKGLTPREASYKAMREVTGPILATTMVLIAVFVPIAFISGLTGQFYRQFALTIAISTVISAFNSLTLSPAISQLILKPEGKANDWLTRGMSKAFGPFFNCFNRVFKTGSNRYIGGIGKILVHRSIAMGVYAALLGLAFVGFQAVPKGFIPVQDKQYLVSFVQLPDGATLERTEDVIREMSDIALKEDGVVSAVAFPGLSINGFTNSSSAGIVFVTLDDFEKRTDQDLSGFAISQKLQQKFSGIEEAFIAILPPPPVPGLGTIGGF